MSAQIARLLTLWGIDPSSTLVPLERGESNLTFRVAASDAAYVLRIHGDPAVEPVRFEHDLLLALAAVELPFATPVPVPLMDGGTIVVVDTGHGPHAAALFRWIPGQNPDDADVTGIALSGGALARLDLALATVRTTLPAPVFEGDMTRVHPAVTDLASLHELDGVARQYVERSADLARSTYPTLPRQLVHGDFALGNVLLQGGCVSGILDFEFAGEDVRAMELANALTLVLSKSTAEALWRPFVGAYLRRLPLNDAELAAVPDLLTLRGAVVLVWWIGRHRTGATPHDWLDRHVRRALALEAWVGKRRGELLEVLARSRVPQPDAAESERRCGDPIPERPDRRDDA